MDLADSDEKGAGRIIGYARVSKRSQREDRQLSRLEKFCDEVRVEKISAVAKSRPVFDKLLLDLKPRDTLAILDLDRAFRSTLEAITTLQMLQNRNIHFKIINANIDTTSEFGEVIFGVLAIFADFERKTIVRRTKEGLAAARNRGQKLGRPFALSDSQIRNAHRIVTQKDQPVYKVAKRLRVSQNTLASGFVRLGLAS